MMIIVLLLNRRTKSARIHFLYISILFDFIFVRTKDVFSVLIEVLFDVFMVELVIFLSSM